MRRAIWFHRARSIGWAIVGVLSFIFGWQNTVALVWIASVYANVVSDWTAAEAADDREIVDRLARLESKFDLLLEALQILQGGPHESGVVVEASDSSVALTAEQPSDPTGDVTVVDNE